ncbi:SPOSA6832_01067 [Sporobolomyces salmonicolor]|uniref:SPOSA6832_01067-mRNA-1:cds n=1 Tax=Sporidiobolus salmonicolor TaxID=5005 RepID=A0A0D6EIT3_SPOSA|nr:SPOSA6832_01067 [Sporobolomyces salmonicolor]
MIVDARTHAFLTARTIPKVLGLSFCRSPLRSPRTPPQMVLIHPVINRETNHLDIAVPSPSGSSSTYSVPLAHPSTYLPDPENDPSLDHDFVVWGCDPQDGYIVGSRELTKALSEYMGRDVLLVRKGLTRRRVADVPGVLHSEELDPVLGELTARIPTVTSKKGFDEKRWSPSSIASQGGLEIQRFRPNIIVEGVQEPFEEDGWKLIKVGKDDEIEVCFRCARCMVKSLRPPVDPDTGVRDKLLPDQVMTDRVVSPVSGPKVCFGMLSAPRKKSGSIKVGDVVTVLDAYPKEAGGGYIRNEDRTN